MNKISLCLLAISLVFGSCSKKIATTAPATPATPAVATATAPAVSATKSDAKAIEIMTAYINAIGGKEKLMSVKTMMTKMSASTGMGEITITNYVKDGKSAMKTEMAGSTVMEQIFDGTVVQVSGMGGTQKLTDGAIIKGAQKQARLFDELDQLLSGKSILKFMGTEDLNGKQVNKITVTDEDKNETTQYFDAATNYLVRTISSVDAMGSKSSQTMDFGDYQDVSGVKFPHSIKMTGGAIPFPLELKVAAMMMNSDLPDQLFKIN